MGDSCNGPGLIVPEVEEYSSIFKWRADLDRCKAYCLSWAFIDNGTYSVKSGYLLGSPLKEREQRQPREHNRYASLADDGWMNWFGGNHREWSCTQQQEHEEIRSPKITEGHTTYFSLQTTRVR